MPLTKQPRRRGTPRTHAVPVRVVHSPRVSRSASAVQPVLPAKGTRRRQSGTPTSARAVWMWIGVVTFSLAIFVGWIGFLQSDLARSSGEDTLFKKIRAQLSTFAHSISTLRFGGNDAKTNTTQLDEIRNSVFPAIKDQEFVTPNENANANRNTNGNGNVNVTP